MHDNLPAITIIGFGAFGKLLAQLLAPLCRVFIYECRADTRDEIRRAGFHPLDHPGAIRGDIIILAVPLQRMQDSLAEIAAHLRAGQIVLDVCSVKEKPALLMQALLPQHVEIIACHPMFGPASAASGIAGQQVVFCPLRGRAWRRLVVILRGCFGLDVIVMTPAEHDRHAALSQGLTHLIARAVLPLAEPSLIRTRSHDLLCEAIAMVAQDSPEVFEAITQHNRYVSEVRERLLLGLGAGPAVAISSSAA